MERLKGKVAIITGASSGIGKASAILFAQEGASVTLAARGADAGEAVAEQIRTSGGKAIFVRTDVSKPEDCANLVQKTIAAFGRLDIGFNNAGIEQVEKKICDLSIEEFDNTIAINLRGVFLCMKYQIPEMLKAGGGSIINTSSLAAIVTRPGMSAYGPSKTGVLSLTKFAAIEYAENNIRVNAILPGAIRTEMLERWLEMPGVEEQILSAQPMGRIGEPIDIANAAVFLASNESSYVSGQSIIVDGAANLPYSARGGANSIP